MDDITRANIKEMARIINLSRNVVFFGGAGVSTESNIPDFRSAKGLFSVKLKSHFTPEQLVSHTFYKAHPEDFFEFYKDKLIYPEAEPNKAHKALAKLEEAGKVKAVITQNIDGLHQAAGSKNVFELHGSVKRNYCEECGAFYDEKYIIQSEGIPVCEKCGGRVKPDVVLYEEPVDPKIFQRAINYMILADTLIVGGTSLAVYPAANLLQYFQGLNLILINKTPTAADSQASLIIRESIGTVFEQVMHQLKMEI
ncbi:MAG: NAD-dependent protein deacylase [Lachnospiraceae bacterium]|nr:NAD-dependent protein deacylase [Lachnospiraceae bacterium]